MQDPGGLLVRIRCRVQGFMVVCEFRDLGSVLPCRASGSRSSLDDGRVCAVCVQAVNAHGTC